METETYRTNAVYAVIPERIMDSLERYAQDHIPTGHFLHSVLENDLTEAVGRADDDCIVALHAIVKFIYNELPGTCWGSPEKVKKWLSEQPAGEKEQKPWQVDPNDPLSLIAGQAPARPAGEKKE